MNWWLFGAFFVTTLLTLLAVYMPGLQKVFDIYPGTYHTKDLIISIALGLTTVPVFEIGKAIHRKMRGTEE
ncbi:MAG: cation transporting ATPase C-terminal domain-containing protein, partial [Firmicutes bacterium]|nr:cation transporting ATPase C-terminal domain-containing protein [Bacillota bacterium]